VLLLLLLLLVGFEQPGVAGGTDQRTPSSLSCVLLAMIPLCTGPIAVPSPNDVVVSITSDLLPGVWDRMIAVVRINSSRTSRISPIIIIIIIIIRRCRPRLHQPIQTLPILTHHPRPPDLEYPKERPVALPIKRHIELRLPQPQSHRRRVRLEVDRVVPREGVLRQAKRVLELAHHAGRDVALLEGDLVHVEGVFAAGDGPDQVDVELEAPAGYSGFTGYYGGEVSKTEPPSHVPLG